MKNLIIILTLLVVCSILRAQTLEETLSEVVNKFERTDTLQSKLNAVNRIDLIASKWNDQWITHYYSAYTKVVVSYLLENEKERDAIIDKAELSLAEAKRLGGISKDEFLVMEAYIANARLSVKSASRWEKYGAIFDARLDEAKKINPSNPRIYFLKGQSLFYTPKAFGGGAKHALPYLEKAANYFYSESKDKLEKPHWGEYMNKFYINESKKDE